MRAADPVAKLGRRKVEELIGAPEHLEEMPRPVTLVARAIGTAHEYRVGQHDIGVGRERTGVLLVMRGAGGEEEAELRPDAADCLLRGRRGDLAITVKRGEVLEIEKTACRRLVDLEIEQGAVRPALDRMDAAFGRQRIAGGVNRKQVARKIGQDRGRRWPETRNDPHEA